MDGRDPDYTPLMYERTHQYREHMFRLRMEDDTQRVFAAHQRFDEACAHLEEMETRTALMRRLMPGGRDQGMRKVLSHAGGLGPSGQHDPDNWHWAVLMKAFLYQCSYVSEGGCLRELRWVMRELNDEKQGDHWEAILGLEVWSRRAWANAPIGALHLPFVDIRPSDLMEYAMWIHEAMFEVEVLIIPYLVRYQFLSNRWSLRAFCKSREASAFLA